MEYDNYYYNPIRCIFSLTRMFGGAFSTACSMHCADVLYLVCSTCCCLIVAISTTVVCLLYSVCIQCCCAIVCYLICEFTGNVCTQTMLSIYLLCYIGLFLCVPSACATASNRQQLVAEGVIPVLIRLLQSKDEDVQYYSAAAISNLAVDGTYTVAYTGPLCIRVVQINHD